ncbi:hypothetical protein [Nocardia spumae]|uniref:hypothetical protein n=1 Tax=Nocardia spumae TaxID=2887190 RepID=UPI001D13AD8B|nr:hypothetical protein [Nocardia spumae]
MQPRITGNRFRRHRSGLGRVPFGRTLLGLTVTAAALALAPTAAQADAGTVYFRSGSTNCALHDNGSFTCGFSNPYNPPGVTIKVAGVDLPVPFGVDQVSYGQPVLPAHPSFGPASDHTLPAGNPDISTVATRQSTWGPTVEYGGTTCSVGFHGSFTCTSHGHTFTTWMSNLAMS